MVKIGDKEVFYSATVILPDGDLVTFDAPVKGVNLRVIVEALNDIVNTATRSEHSIEPTAFLSPTLRIKIFNWSSSLVQTFAKPLQAGALNDGTPIGYNIAVFWAGGPRVIVLQLLIGGSY
jgi:hypothetical protein